MSLYLCIQNIIMYHLAAIIHNKLLINSVKIEIIILKTIDLIFLKILFNGSEDALH